MHEHLTMMIVDDFGKCRASLSRTHCCGGTFRWVFVLRYQIKKPFHSLDSTIQSAQTYSDGPERCAKPRKSSDARNRTQTTTNPHKTRGQCSDTANSTNRLHRHRNAQPVKCCTK